MSNVLVSIPSKIYIGVWVNNSTNQVVYTEPNANVRLVLTPPSKFGWEFVRLLVTPCEWSQITKEAVKK